MNKTTVSYLVVGDDSSLSAHNNHELKERRLIDKLFLDKLKIENDLDKIHRVK